MSHLDHERGPRSRINSALANRPAPSSLPIWTRLSKCVTRHQLHTVRQPHAPMRVL